MASLADPFVCTLDLLQKCESWYESVSRSYNCSLPGLAELPPGLYEGQEANFLSFVTEIAAPNLPIQANEFEACTGGKVLFSDAENLWEDPVQDIGTKTSRGE